jgi:hypothetical protein
VTTTDIVVADDHDHDHHGGAGGIDGTTRIGTNVVISVYGTPFIGCYPRDRSRLSISRSTSAGVL